MPINYFWSWACGCVSVVKHRAFMDSFQNMSWSAWKPSENQAFLSSINLLGVGMLLTLIFPEMADTAQLNWLYWSGIKCSFSFQRQEKKWSSRPSLRGSRKVVAQQRHLYSWINESMDFIYEESLKNVLGRKYFSWHGASAFRPQRC